MALADQRADLPERRIGRRPRHLEQLGDPGSEGPRLRQRHPLVGQRGPGDPPAAVDLADHAVVRHEHVVQEHLVEQRIAGDLAQRPHLDARARTCPPGSSVIPSCLGAAGSVRAMQIAQAACLASEVQIFWPVSRQPPSARSARVVSPARSEPAPGSLNSWHHRKSPRSVGGRNRCCCCGRAVLDQRGHHPGADHQAGRPDPGGPHLLVDDELLERARRRGPTGRGRCGVTQPSAASRRVRSCAGERRRSRRARPGSADRSSASPSGSFDLDGPAGAGQGQPGHLAPPTHRTGRAARAATSPAGSTGEPRVPRCSRCRRVPGCTRARTRPRRRWRPRRPRSRRSRAGARPALSARPCRPAPRLRSAPAGLSGRARGVPDRRGGLLGRGQHPGAAVLDRLELADRPAELVTDLGVIGGGVRGPVGDAGRLGAEHDRGQAGDRAAGPARSAAGRLARRRRSARIRATGRVRSRLSSAVISRPAASMAAQTSPSLGLHPGDDQVGQAGPEHGRGLPVDDQAAVRARPGPVSPVASGDRAARRPGRPRGRPEPSASPVDQLPAGSGRHSTALASTVGRNAPGTSARPSSSSATASSGRPNPGRRRSSGTCRPRTPCSARAGASDSR